MTIHSKNIPTPTVLVEDGLKTLSCPQPPAIKALQAYCSLGGHWRVKKHHELINRTINEMVLLYCVAGGGWLSVDGINHPVKAGDILYCPANIEHGYGCNPDTGWEIWWTHFCGSHAAHLCNESGLSAQSPVLHIGIKPEIQRPFADLYHTLEMRNHDVAWKAARALHTLLIELVHQANMQHDSPRLLDLIDPNSGNLDDMARQAGYSKYHFSRLFKEQTGSTPWQYILERKLDRARELLIGTRLSIKEIAAELGFENPDYFSRLFAKRMGILPKHYRGSSISQTS